MEQMQFVNLVITNVLLVTILMNVLHVMKEETLFPTVTVHLDGMMMVLTASNVTLNAKSVAQDQLIVLNVLMKESLVQSQHAHVLMDNMKMNKHVTIVVMSVLLVNTVQKIVLTVQES